MGIPLEASQQATPDNLPPSSDLSAWRLAVRLAAQVTPRLEETMERFWGIPVRLRFFSVSLQSHYYWQQDDFHVSQLVLGDAGQTSGPASAALLRISDSACAALLAKVLGSRQRPFSFKQISPLEGAILNDFSKDLLADLMKGMIQKGEKLSSSSSEQLHFIWNFQLPGAEASSDPAEALETGRIVLSVPPQFLRVSEEAEEEAEEEAGEIPDEWFFHVSMPARIRVGSSRLPLSDLNRLEPGDWVVLEESDAERMALVDPGSGEALSFLVEIAQRHKLTVPYTQELATMETQQAEARQNLWDNLMIEVNAEFAPIKLPLKELKQMSEGLIVEVGDLVNNQIALQVEGKTLAWGELIVVGDKFGVRITQVEGSYAAANSQATEESSHDEDEEEEHNEDESEDSGEDDDDDFLNDDFEDDEDEW